MVERIHAVLRLSTFLFSLKNNEYQCPDDGAHQPDNRVERGSLRGPRLMRTIAVCIGLTSFMGVFDAHGQCSDKADFSYTITDCDEISIKNETPKKGGVDEYHIDWGNGDIDTMTSFNSLTYSYGARKMYSVKLVTKRASCRDSLIKTINLPARVAQNFGDTVVCVGEVFDFQARLSSSTNLNAPDSFIARFGDGGVARSTSFNHSHAYSSPGTYKVKQEFVYLIKGKEVCRDKEEPWPEIKVWDTTVTIFQPSEDTVCVDHIVEFSNSSFVKGATDNIKSYQWDFDDGSTSTLKEPEHAYGKPGIYYPSLTTTTDNGECKGVDFDTIWVCPGPKVKFSFADKCDEDTVEFVNLSSPSKCDAIDSFVWDFGDMGKTETRLDTIGPKHLYPGPGTYFVKLTAYVGAISKSYSYTETVGIYPRPEVRYSAENVCAYNEVVFKDQSEIASGSIDHIIWDFDDNVTDKKDFQSQFSYQYKAHGSYDVKSIHVSDKGCIDTIYLNVVIHPVPKAGFQASRACVGYSVNFTNESTIQGDGKIAAYAYNFDNGNISSKGNDQTTYNTVKTYSPQLIIESDKGCIDTFRYDLEVRPNPKSSFEHLLVGCVRTDDIAFSNTSKQLNSETATWTFPDTVLTNWSPKYTFSSVGTHDVKLLVTNSFGCTDEAVNSIDLIDKPQPNFTVSPDTGCNSVEVTISLVNEKKYNEYFWDLDNGKKASGTKPPTQVFNALNFKETAYQVVLRDSNKCGVVSLAKPVILQPLPKSSFTVSGTDSACSPREFKFRNTSVGSPDTLIWDFDKDTSITELNPQSILSHIFAYDISPPNSKEFKIRLTAINVCGSHSSEQQVTVFSKNVTANFRLVDSRDLYGCLNHSLELKDTSINARNGFYLMGDSTGQKELKVIGGRFKYTYEKPGQFEITQVVSGCGKDSLTYPDKIFVYENPVALIEGLQDFYCSGEEFTLKATGSGLSKEWLIDTDPNFQSTNPAYQSTSSEPTLSLSTTGSDTTKYYIRLKVARFETTGPVCRSTTIDSVMIVRHPTAKMNYKDFVEECQPFEASFKNLSNKDHYKSFVWELYKFDETSNQLVQKAKSTIAKNFQNEFFNSSDSIERWRLRLTVDNKTCIDSISLGINILPQPRSKFDFDLLDGGIKQCNTESTMAVSFENLSQPEKFIEYIWDFGDKDTSYVTNPTHTFQLDTTQIRQEFTVVLSSINAPYECRDTFSKIVTILSQPKIRLRTKQIPICEGIPKLFTPFIVEKGATYVWDFSDGVVGIDSGFTRKFDIQAKGDNVGVEFVDLTLRVSFDNGCKDTLFVDSLVKVYQLPTTRFSIAKADTLDDECYPDGIKEYEFNSMASTNSRSFYWDFGDGGSSLYDNPSRVFQNPGTSINHDFKVKLMSANDLGCKDSITQVVNVLSNPAVDFSSKKVNICNGELVELKPDTTQPKARYTWVFNDTLRVISDTFFSPVQITIPTVIREIEHLPIRLHVKLPNGCQDSLERDSLLNIYYQPESKFWFAKMDTLDDECYPKGVKRVRFYSDSSSNASSFQWDFDNGNTSEKRTPTPTFRLKSTQIRDSFHVRLVTKNALKCPDTSYAFVSVLADPEVLFSPKKVNVCEGVDSSFTPSVIQNVATYTWSINDTLRGTRTTFPWRVYLEEKAPTSAFRGFSVKLLASFPNGCKDSLEYKDYLRIHHLPKSSFYFAPLDTLDDDCYPMGRKKVLFNADSSTSSLKYRWQFGDGKGSWMANPQNTYQLSSNSIDSIYSVELVTLNNLGCSDTLVKMLEVLRSPEVMFDTMPKIRICQDGDTLLYPTSTRDGAAYTWTVWSNDTTYLSNTKNYRITFDRGDSLDGSPFKFYHTKLKMTLANGCADSLTIKKMVRVYDLPESKFWITKAFETPDNCYPSGERKVAFNSSPSANVNAQKWSFGDGVTSGVRYPLHTYALDTSSISDTFNVKFSVTNALGCTDSSFKQFVLNRRPKVRFDTVNVIARCEYDSLSLIPGNWRTGANYIWKVWSSTNSQTFSTRKLSSAFSIGDTSFKVGVVPYAVQLKVELPNGCENSQEVDSLIMIHQLPDARFSFSVINGRSDSCYALGKSAYFFNGSVAKNSFQYAWDFDNGKSSTGSILNHGFVLNDSLIEDSFWVKLLTSNALGCKDSVSKKVQFKRMPRVRFTTVFQDSICELDTADFKPSFWRTGASYLWTATTPKDKVYGANRSFRPIIDMADSTGKFEYENYAVKLTVNLSNGCKDSLKVDDVLRVHFLPQARFSKKTVNPQPDDCYADGEKSYQFNSSWSHNAFRYDWAYGDDSIGIVSNPIHKYELDDSLIQDSFRITLKVENNKGCADSMKKWVQVKRLPKTAFSRSSSYEICDLDPILFEPLHWRTGAKYVWKAYNPRHFATDTLRKFRPAIDLTDTSGVRAYEDFDIQMKVVLDNGCEDDLRKDDVLRIHYYPTSRFSFQVLDERSDSCYPNGQKSYQFNPNGSRNAQKFQWDFGDGTIKTARSDTHQFSLDPVRIIDHFLVNLKVENGPGCTDTLGKWIQVKRLPKVAFKRSTVIEVCEEQDTVFSPTFHRLGGTYTWTVWSDWEAQKSVGKDFKTSFILPDTLGETRFDEYDVKLHVKLANGCKDSLVGPDLLRVFSSPISRFKATVVDSTEDDCYAQGSKKYNFNPDRSTNTDSLKWRFGDGAETVVEYPKHQYSINNGQVRQSFTVVLEVANKLGCSDKSDTVITVEESPVATFNETPFRICEDSTYKFEPLIFHPDARYSWFFSDNDSVYGLKEAYRRSFSINEGADFPAFEEIDVTLVIEYGPTGCKDSVKVENMVRVIQNPRSYFDFSVLESSTDSCYEDGRVNAVFKADSTANAQPETFRWDFGDGTLSSNKNPDHTFQLNLPNNQKLFPVSLTTRNRECTHTYTKGVLVKSLPDVDFTSSDPAQCAGLEVCFEVAEKSLPGAVSYDWIFGDWQQKAGTKFCRIFSTTDSFESQDVKLIITLDNGCVDSLVKPDLVRVNRKPIADFKHKDVLVNPYTGDMAHGRVHFEDHSQYAGTAAQLKNYWDLGNGKFLNNNLSFDTLYDYNQSYTVEYMIEDIHGCRDTLIKPIRPAFFFGLYMPNALSPEVGVKEEERIFLPKGFGLYDYHLKIFDQSGHLLFESFALDTTGAPLEYWDGTYKGKLLPQAVYQWQAKGTFRNGLVWPGMKQKNGRLKTVGNINLIR